MSTKCPKCFHNLTSPNHLPLILPSCLHHLCSSCVNSSHGFVQCFVTICKERNKQQEESQMVYDYYMLGRKEVNRYRIRQNKMQKFHDSDAQLEPSLFLQIGPGSIRCINCKNTMSKLSCTTCMTNFCSPCFTTTHSTPELATHTGVQYQAIDGLFLRKCEDHSRPVEFVSVDDGKLGCSHCALFGGMREKKVVDLGRVEREIKESGILKKSMDKVTSALGRCQLVKKELYFHSSDFQSAKDSVESHLFRCHRMLEVVEEKLMSKLRQREEEHNLTVWKTRNKLEEKIGKLEMLVEAAEWQSEDEMGNRMNLVKLLEEMEKMQEDDVVLKTHDQKSPIVNIDQSVFNVLSDHIALDLATVPSLVTTTVPQNQLSKELSVLLDRFKEEKESVVGIRLMREHFPGMEEVNIMHVESPESFYVMMKKDIQLAESLKKLVEKEWNAGEKGKVKVGDMAVVYMEGRYSRVYVTKVIPGSATVSYPDQGHTSQVPLPSLVSLSANLSLYNCPPLAHHCTLASCGGTVQVGWRAARAVHVFGMGNFCRVAVVGRNASISQSTMMVNVTKEDDDGNTISLLDYLVYHDMATGGACPQIRAVRTITDLPPVKAGTEHSVIVVEVNSPGEIFVVIEGNGYTEDLARLLKDLQAQYEQKAVEEQMILLPVKGMVCVAKFSKDGKFYRAVVTDVGKKRMVSVFFVDFGNSGVVEVGDLRRIKNKFLELPAMAVKVGLADVQPMGKKWNEEAAGCVRDLVKKKVLRMVVREVGKKACKVMMYEWNVKDQDCVNIKLVIKGYARPLKRLIKHPDYEMFLPSRPDPPVPGMRTVCCVVRASSPVKICIRKMCQEESFYQLCRDLSSHFSESSSLPGVRHWHAGGGCVVRLQGEGWVRARVLKEEMEGLVEVFLVDYGVQEVVGVDSIRTLPDKFTMAPFCWTVHLIKLTPAGGAKKWTVVACEKLKELLVRTGMVVEIQVVGDIVEGSWPVDLFVQEKDESAGPLDPGGFITKSVGDILKEEGLAIQLKDRPMTLMKRNSAVSEQINHYNSPNVRSDGINECIVEDLLKEVINDVVLESYGGNNNSQWLEADLPSCSEFTCSVSHVDWDCNLYISTIPGNQDTLRIIQSVLLSKYSGSAHSQDDLHWTASEACIARFHLDKRWYRGTVLKVLETGECLVKFVDYGSEERVKPVNMRKGLFLTEVPIQCFTVQMDNVRSITEHWDEDVLDFLHKTVVDQELRVSIIQVKDTFPLPVTLSTKSGLDIGKMLVKNGYAREGESIIGVQ